MLDSFFNKGFKAAKCKTLLKLTIPRVKLLRNRREVQIKQMRREIAKLLETGQEVTARIRVEHVIREEKMMAAQEIIELFCELIVARLPIIEAQRECPLDLKEAISSVCFAASRCADLPELLQVQTMFAAKYGKEFVSAATELMPECGVNRKLVELFSVRAPTPDVKLKLLKGIAEEHELDWDPNASESELLKPHEDLLSGSSQVIGSSKSSFPNKKHDDTNYSANEQAQAPSEEFDSDEDFEIVDLPEVPKQSMHSAENTVSVASDRENENLSNLVQHNSVAKESESMKCKQFVPFISPPSQFSTSFSVGEEDDHRPSVLRPESEMITNLQDVLLAAEAAAETADGAAAAAWSAASLAQLRISELSKKTSSVQSDACSENPFHKEMQSRKSANLGLVNSGSPSPSQEKKSLDACSENPFHEEIQGIGTADLSSPSQSREGECGDELEHYSTELPVYDDTEYCRPQRLASMDDDMIFAYPNLFSSQG